MLNTWRINADDGEWFLVQTNYDHWIPMPPWDNRKAPAEKTILEVGAEEISPSTIYSESFHGSRAGSTHCLLHHDVVLRKDVRITRQRLSEMLTVPVTH